MRYLIMIVVLLLAPAMAFSYSGGPPDERTGAPGENNCTQCHNSFPVNSGDGDFVISGPTTFVAGETYTITVELADTDQLRWGFELTPLSFGDITITDPTNTQQSSSGNNTYVKHTSSGTFSGTPNGPVSWSFEWTAPVDPPDSVVFYAAGNAANNNGGTSGDYIYTTSFSTHRLVSGIDDGFASLPTHLNLGNYPNPFNASTTISYTIPTAGFAKLEVYDLTGKLVTTLIDGHKNAGQHSVVWNASDVSSGIYLYILTSENRVKTQKMVLVK